MNPAAATTRLLDVHNLSVAVSTGEGTRELIHRVSVGLFPHEVLVILGESGSGKTILSRSLTKLFPPAHPMNLEGSVVFEGQQLLALDEAGLAPIRRKKIRYVFQEPMQSLNPLAQVGTQLRLAGDPLSTDASALTSALRSVGLEADEVVNLFPHQLSTGMAQRICIAMAILPSPSLLIADEPTSAVDASMRYALIDLVVSVQRGTGMALILITHDLAVARQYGDRIVVMYGGRIVESASREQFFAAPLHPYSQLLVDAETGIGNVMPVSYSAAGTIPDRGCRFHEHCPRANEKCREAEPELDRTADGGEVRCFYWK